ncbi:hypothetical protein BLS_008371 [Venturia inaequalis]|uniref:BTB domain-containing protein n=1 Tax=Venturia inaequalis TaxID=5025 RepID=A0A8H3U6P7_VENIN|nr:hypothetical protein BLS_008371 [Venturia inaequalis]
MPSQLQGLNAAALSCLDSGDHSDLTIKCNDRDFKVHRMVLCPQSPFFAKAVKKHAFEEGQTGVISMNHDDPDAIEAMLQFLYTGDYNTENLTMQNHLKIYELADKVDVSALKTLCEDKFNAMARNNWKDLSFPGCMKTAYDITPPGPSGENLRSIVVKIASENVKQLFQLDTGFKQMLADVAELGADMVEFLAKSSSQSDNANSSRSDCSYLCRHCWSSFTIAVRCGFDVSCPRCGGAN